MTQEPRQPPPTRPHVPAETPPRPMDHHERMRCRTAAFRVKRLYAGVVGEILSQEILSWEEFGYCLGNSSRVRALVDHVMTAPMPTTAVVKS